MKSVTKPRSTILMYLVLLASVLLLSACVADPQPDIPMDVGSVDPDRIRVNPGSGSNRVLVTGLDGATEGHGTRVQVQNLRSGVASGASVGSDGSFTIEVDATPTQVLGLTLQLGNDFGETVFVAGNAEREAVEIGGGEECEIRDFEVEECLVCRLETGEEEVVGCELTDFFPDEAPLNPANIAECLFLSSDFIDMERISQPEDDFDLRFGQADVFNGCGEPVFFIIGEFLTEREDRFTVFPEIGETVFIEPTFFGTVEIFYEAHDRGPEDPGDFAEAIIDVFIPFEEGEEHLGTMILNVSAE